MVTVREIRNKKGGTSYCYCSVGLDDSSVSHSYLSISNPFIYVSCFNSIKVRAICRSPDCPLLRSNVDIDRLVLGWVGGAVTVTRYLTEIKNS